MTLVGRKSPERPWSPVWKPGFHQPETSSRQDQRLFRVPPKIKLGGFQRLVLLYGFRSLWRIGWSGREPLASGMIAAPCAMRAIAAMRSGHRHLRLSRGAPNVAADTKQSFSTPVRRWRLRRRRTADCPAIKIVGRPDDAKGFVMGPEGRFAYFSDSDSLDGCAAHSFRRFAV